MDYSLFVDLFRVIYTYLHQAEYLFQSNLKDIILLVNDEIDDSRLKLVTAQERDTLRARRTKHKQCLDVLTRQR
jgi:hypothetical protein